MKNIFFTKLFVLTLLPASSIFTIPATDAIAGNIIYKVEASNPRLIRNVTGPIIASVDGVPAEPVDSFVLDGVGTTKIKGKLKYELDPVANTGEIVAEWEDVNGHWTYRQTQFVAPGHPTGARIGPSINDVELIKGDPITTNVYLHGDTGAAAPIIPTVFNLTATWGPAEITRNGVVFDNPFNGPVPKWGGHTMTSEKLRSATDGTVKTKTGAIYTPADSAKGAVNHKKYEVHLVFAAPATKNTTNVPPPLAFFYHLVFNDVKIKIKH